MDERNREDLYAEGVENTVEGKAKEMKGRVKDAAGAFTGDTSLQAEGKMDKAKGKLQDKLGDAQREIAD